MWYFGTESSSIDMTSLLQFDKITVLLQLVDKLATSLLRTHLVDKLWDFHVCNVQHKRTKYIAGFQWSV
jgi:hypothetical protein